MTRQGFRRLAVAGVLCLSGAARAQGIPVYDNAEYINSLQQLIQWGNQLTAMANQLTQLKAQYESLNGLRGVGDLLNSELVVQYLPTNYVGAVEGLKTGTGDFAGISGALNDIVKANQLKACADTATTTAARDRCDRDWQALALNKKVGDMGYQQAAKNITLLQTFVKTIMSSPDPKTMQDLQARINVETVRIQNEELKLKTVAMMDQADKELKRRASTDAFSATLTTSKAGKVDF